MTKEQYKNWFWFAFVIITVTALYFWFYKSPYFQTFFEWSKQNLLIFIPTLLFLKIIAIIYPPIPGGTFTLGAIPILGWPLAYLIDFSGSILGGSIAYFLGKKYGFPLLRKFLSEDIIEKIKKIKIKKGKEIETVFIYKTLLGSTILEAIYYGAGVMNINFGKFLIGSILSQIVVGVPTFLLAGAIFEGKNLILIATLSMVALIFIIKTKGRYFE